MRNQAAGARKERTLIGFVRINVRGGKGRIDVGSAFVKRAYAKAKKLPFHPHASSKA